MCNIDVDREPTQAQTQRDMRLIRDWSPRRVVDADGFYNTKCRIKTPKRAIGQAAVAQL